MEQNQNKNQNNNGPKMNMPRFNMNWIYFLVIATLIALYFSNEGGIAEPTVNVETSYTDFQTYMDKGYASKLTVDKSQGIVKMYVKPEHIRDVFKQGVEKVGKDPYVSVEIGSLDKLIAVQDLLRLKIHFIGIGSFRHHRYGFFGIKRVQTQGGFVRSEMS